MLLENKVALITGSSSGIGATTAKLFAREGARVIINYRSDEGAAKRVLSEIKKNKKKNLIIQADVAVPADVEAMFYLVEKEYGKLDILVNNAGIDRPKAFGELAIKDWDETMRTNLYGVFLCSQKAAELMKSGGKILNTASVRGLEHCGRKGNLVYTVSKAGVVSMTKALAKELAPEIAVNAVAPGPTNTEIRKVWSKKTYKKNIEESYFGRLMEPGEIASAFLFLASEMASGLTGEVIVVDGGYNLQ